MPVLCVHPCHERLRRLITGHFGDLQKAFEAQDVLDLDIDWRAKGVHQLNGALKRHRDSTRLAWYGDAAIDIVGKDGWLWNGVTREV